MRGASHFLPVLLLGRPQNETTVGRGAMQEMGLGPREEASAWSAGKPEPQWGLVSLPFSPLSLALPDSPPGCPPPHPPLEGGAWLHPHVAELYASSRQRSWGVWH